MPRYIAFLRGINVGGHRVKMDHLRGLFEALGYVDVSTFIASGNVVFSTSSGDVEAIEGEIEAHLESELGYEVATFLRTPAELQAIAAGAPSVREGDDGASDSVYVMFLSAPAAEDLRARLAELESEMDRFSFAGREVYWLIAGKLSESPLFGRGFEKATRSVANTMRNMTTVRKLIAKVPG